MDFRTAITKFWTHQGFEKEKKLQKKLMMTKHALFKRSRFKKTVTILREGIYVGTLSTATYDSHSIQLIRGVHDGQLKAQIYTVLLAVVEK